MHYRELICFFASEATLRAEFSGETLFNFDQSANPGSGICKLNSIRSCARENLRLVNHLASQAIRAKMLSLRCGQRRRLVLSNALSENTDQACSRIQETKTNSKKCPELRRKVFHSPASTRIKLWAKTKNTVF